MTTGFFYSDLSTRQGRAGHIHDTGNHFDRPTYLVDVGTKEQRTIVVDTAANSTAYAWTLNGTAQTITSAASATKASIALQIANYINASALNTTFYAEDDGVDTVTITHKTAGTAFTLTDADGNITTALLTSAVSAASVPPGVIVMESARNPGFRGSCVLPTSNTAVAQVVDVTPEYSAGDEWVLTVTVGGVPYTGMVTMTTDLETTLDAMEEALNEGSPDSAFTIADDPTTKLTITAGTAGTPIYVTSTVTDVGGVSTAVTVTTTTANVEGTFTRDILGPVLLEQTAELSGSLTQGGTSTTISYEAGRPVAVGRVGRYDVLLDSGETVAAGDPVYVRTTAGATEQLGACRNDTDSGDCVLWSRATFISANFTGIDGQNCATIEVYDQAA